MELKSEALKCSMCDGVGIVKAEKPWKKGCICDYHIETCDICLPKCPTCHGSGHAPAEIKGELTEAEIEDARSWRFNYDYAKKDVLCDMALAYLAAKGTK